MSTAPTPKPYEITFEQRDGYLYACVEGPFDSYEISNAYWKDVAAECEKRQTRKLLLDERLDSPMPSMTEVFQGASERCYMGLSGIKIAFVDTKSDHHEFNLFGELVATNRGLFCKVFNDIAAGERWLLAD
jgi:hypothetical protein